MALFEYKAVDQEYYEREIKDFLPERMIDAHTHVFSEDLRDPIFVDKREEGRAQNWPSLVARENPIEDLEETYRLMFPGKQVTPVIFGYPSFKYNIALSNEYIFQVAKKTGYPSLMLATPAMTATELKYNYIKGGHKGLKVYLEFAPSYIPGNEIRVFDFAPHHQLEVLNECKGALMLHIPRSGRLKDPVNIAEMLEIDRRYPDIKLIIAHIGRAYAYEDLGDSLQILKDSKMWFDFSANTNQQVFEETLRIIGPNRLMFGSDLPIVRMRMKRIVENGRYINVIAKGSYGNVTGDPHMREIEGEEANALSFFMYEMIASMRRACETVGISRKDVEAIFFENAATWFDVGK